jgi:hypothetical protein
MPFGKLSSFPRILITFLKNFSDQGSLKLEGADSISYSSGKKKQMAIEFFKNEGS